MDLSLKRLKEIAVKLKKEVKVILCAYKMKETPIIAKIVALFVVSYALSPIDLIPDFIPILGYLDDLILLPLLIRLAIRLIPDEILAKCRLEVETAGINGAKERAVGLAIVIGIWLLFGYIIINKFLS